MFNKLKEKLIDLFVNRVLGRVAASIARVIVSYLLAHNDILGGWGISIGINADELTLAIYGLFALIWHKILPVVSSTNRGEGGVSPKPGSTT